MIREIQFSPSTFIVDNDDTHYFNINNQDDYRKKSAAAIGKALEKVEMCEKSEEKLSALFFELLTDFGSARKDIAESHNIDNAKDFGKRRDPFSGHCATCLDDVYKPYNGPILEKIRKLLDPYAKKLERCTGEKIKVIEKDHFQGYDSSFEVEVYDEDEVAELLNLKPIYIPEDLSAQDLEIRRKAFESFYDDKYDVLTKIELCGHIKTLHKKYPYLQKSGWNGFVKNEANIKSFYALGTARFTVEGKPIVVSQYLIWLHRDGIMHPLFRMQQHTICTVIHQPGFLVESTLKQVSQLFAKALLLDKKQNKEVKECVGIFRAYFTHACCFNRGSASIGEYFETLLYHYHGFRLRYSSDTLVDLEAFVTPLLSKFLANYRSMIQLEAYA